MANPPSALSIGATEAGEAFAGQVARFVRTAEELDDLDLLVPGRCHGWAVLDVVTHVRVGLEEMLRGACAPTDEQPTVDAPSYSSAWAAGEDSDEADSDAVDGILWTRRTSSSYRRPSGAVAHLRAAADAVLDAVLPARAVRFQGHVISVGDFLATWAVELAVHQVDLGLALDVGLPTPAALRLTRLTIEALLGEPLPPSIGDLDVLLIGAGRMPAPVGFAQARSVLG